MSRRTARDLAFKRAYARMLGGDCEIYDVLDISIEETNRSSFVSSTAESEESDSKRFGSKDAVGIENAENITVKKQRNSIRFPKQIDDADFEFIQKLVNGIDTYQADLDSEIEKYSIGWKLERIAKVDLCILRIAIFEMLHCDEIPESVSINEAVELAKRYSGTKSASFINGILGGISRKEVTIYEASDTIEFEPLAVESSPPLEISDPL